MHVEILRMTSTGTRRRAAPPMTDVAPEYALADNFDYDELLTAESWDKNLDISGASIPPLPSSHFAKKFGGRKA